MKTQVPKFENRQVHGSGIAFSGVTRRPVGAFEQGEKVVLMVEAEVTRITHAERAKIGLTREHALKVLDVQIPDQAEAKRHIVELQDEFEEKHGGRKKLPLNGDGEDDDT